MSPRYLIGLDLGTTNSAVAYVDTTERRRGGRPVLHQFRIPQVVRDGEVDARETLPSFLYFPTPDELSDVSAVSVSAPPAPARPVSTPPATAPSDSVMEQGFSPAAPRAVVGTYARDHGALVPGRQVTSAKSWLCNPAVDRTAPILPWGHDEGQPACSPIDASARFLEHLRDAWNLTYRDAPDAERFERQIIVLTVPASFDEEARELTLEAAHKAGLEQVVLLEEPLSAFYAWLATHAASFRRLLREGDEILICDVGGGTTDFTLIKAAAQADGDVRFERTAVGEHLLLGGDNLDLALARNIEEKLGAEVRLTLTQRQALARLTSAAKEHLLSDPRTVRTTLAIPAAGRSIVGGRLSAELTRQEVIDTMRAGFLPAVARDDLPARGTRHGLREFGLPYAHEPAITRHLAAFLARTHARPSAILFNGGFFTPEIARDAIVRTLESWFAGGDPSWHLAVLTNRNPAAAVAVGGAYYAFVRDHGGIRVSGGSSRVYYVGLAGQVASATNDQPPTNDQQPTTDDHVLAVCVMPRGTEEGTGLDLAGRQFTVATNRPIAFRLFSSTVRAGRLGEIVELDVDEVHEHARLVTILRYGKKSRQPELPVHLSVRFTEVGTLELWCHSDVSDHRWRLQFELRSTEHAGDEDERAADAVAPLNQPATSPDAADASDEAAVVISADAIQQAAAEIRAVFAEAAQAPPTEVIPAAESASPESLVAHMEGAVGFARQAWPLAVIRQFADVLLECVEGRRKGPRFESRWLNLAGFCLRPGFGATLDEWRMDQMRRVYLAGHLFAKDIQGEAEWLVLWQRAAGGLTAGQQQELYQRCRAALGLAGKKEVRRVNPQIEREGWRLLASLELLQATTRASLGTQLLALVTRQPSNAALLWALGRLGARIPSYGPLNTVVSAATVQTWIEGVLSRRGPLSADMLAAIVQMAARTDDPHRDVNAGLRANVTERLKAAGAPADDIARVERYVPPAFADGLRLFGETLPDGLRLAT